MRKVFIIFILGIIHPVFADLVSEHLPTHKTCGLPRLIQQDVASRMDKMKLNDPIQYQALLQENEQLIRFNKINSRQQMFWAYNFNTDEFYTITATLRKNGEMVKIWVEDESWNNNYVNNTTLDVLLSNLEEFSGSWNIFLSSHLR
ncbi:MAG: hypothetical protein GQ561_01155 [Calditrichae bacterium]|nr:hypothetical protein [Calditrichia bacterium]